MAPSAHEKAVSWYSSDSDVPPVLERLRALHRELSVASIEFAQKSPALLSHVNYYANDLDKLRRYAGDVVARRMRMLGVAQLLKTRFFVDMYLTGFERANPYSLFMACRAQIESHAIAWDAFRVVQENAGDEAGDFVARVRACDEALLKAYFGTRTLLEFTRNLPGSKLRTFGPEEKVFAAENVLNRIDKLSKTDNF